MFQWLRKMIFPIIVIALASFTGLIILQWGADMASRDRNTAVNYAAKINDQEISWRQYQSIRDILFRQQSQATEEELTEAQVRRIDEEAWNQILQTVLLIQEAEKNNLSVSEEEVYQYLRYSPPEYLQDVPQFLTDGKFDYQKYFGTMLDENAAPFWESVKPRVREDILKMKVQQLVVQTTQVSDEEVKQYFLDNSEKVKLGLINVSHGLYGRPDIDEEELKQYFADHQDDYLVEERAVLKMVKIDKEASEADWERTYRRIKIVYDSIQAGADFAEMAQNYGEDGSAEKGGDLGWFSADKMVEQFSDVAFTMQDGDLSEPFRTSFGWHIVKHHGYRTGKQMKQGAAGTEDVQEANCSHILIRTVASTSTLDGIDERLREFAASAADVGFDNAGRDARLRVEELKPFASGARIDKLGQHRQTSDWAFESKIGDISTVMETNAVVFVVQLTDKIPAGVAAFEDVKDAVDLAVRNEKLRAICQDTANAIHSEVLSGKNLAQAARGHGVEYKETDLVHRNSYIQGVGRNPIVLGAGFSLTENGQVSKPVTFATGTAIVELLERTTPDLSEFNEKRDSLSTNLMLSKQQELYRRWFDKLVADADIEINIAGLN